MRHLNLAAMVLSLAPLSAVAAEHTVFFDLGSARLDAEARAVVEQAAADYAATGSAVVSLVGHTDTTASAEFNMALSERRARTVAEALSAAGVPAASMTAAWRGEEDLAVPTADNVAERLNRRVEITISDDGAAVAPAVVETVEDVVRGLRVGLGPYLGFNMDDPHDSYLWGGNLTVSYDVTPNIALSAEQAVFYSSDTLENGWGGRSAVGADYSFGDMGGGTPYVGVNGGYMYIDGTATGGWFGGPEIGFRFGQFEVKAAYDFVEDRDAEEGVISLTAGYIFNF